MDGQRDGWMTGWLRESRLMGHTLPGEAANWSFLEEVVEFADHTKTREDRSVQRGQGCPPEGCREAGGVGWNSVGTNAKPCIWTGGAPAGRSAEDSLTREQPWGRVLGGLVGNDLGSSSTGGHRNVARRSREGIILPYSACLHAASGFGPPSTGGTSQTWSEGLLETLVSSVKAKIPKNTFVHLTVSTKNRWTTEEGG